MHPIRWQPCGVVCRRPLILPPIDRTHAMPARPGRLQSRAVRGILCGRVPGRWLDGWRLGSVCLIRGGPDRQPVLLGKREGS